MLWQQLPTNHKPGLAGLFILKRSIMSDRYFVEVSRYSGSYKPRYSFPNTEEGLQQAVFYFRCINIGHGYNKRLRDVQTNKVLARARTS